MPTTSNFGWTTPADTDLVKDGAAAIRTLGNGIDTSFLDLKGGTTDQVLAKNSNTDLDFKWVAQDDSNAIQNAIVDAKGDLISATAADTPARLAVGANGTVLTADSAEATGLKWATVSAGGFTQLATGTLSGATVSITGISGDYQDLVLIVLNYRPTTDGQSLQLRFNQDSNANRHISRSDAAVYGQAFNATSAQILGTTDSTTNNGFGVTTIYQYARTGTWKLLTSLLIESNDTTTTQADFDRRLGIYNQTGAITSFDLFSSSGNMTAGTYYLYGVK